MVADFSIKDDGAAEEKKPLGLRFRPTTSQEVQVLHGDDMEKLVSFKADTKGRKFFVRVDDPSRVVLTNAMIESSRSKTEAKHKHEPAPAPYGITRNWRIEDDKFIVWNDADAEIVLPIAPKPGYFTPIKAFEVFGQGQLLYDVAMAFVEGTHTMIDGPTGTGKTSMAMWLAYILNWNFVLMPINRRTESHNMVGEYTPSEKKGVFEWTDGPVTAACRASQKHPTILLFDEVNRIGNVSEYSRIYSLLDDSRRLTLPEKRNGTGVGEEVVAGDLFVVATSNPVDTEEGAHGMADYIGVQELDPAMASRFLCNPPIDYPDPAAEAGALADRVKTLSLDEAIDMVESANKIRRAAEIRFPISFRELEGWARFMPYQGKARAAEIAVVRKANPIFRADIRNFLALRG